MLFCRGYYDVRPRIPVRTGGTLMFLRRPGRRREPSRRQLGFGTWYLRNSPRARARFATVGLTTCCGVEMGTPHRASSSETASSHKSLQTTRLPRFLSHEVPLSAMTHAGGPSCSCSTTDTTSIVMTKSLAAVDQRQRPDRLAADSAHSRSCPGASAAPRAPEARSP